MRVAAAYSCFAAVSWALAGLPGRRSRSTRGKMTVERCESLPRWCGETCVSELCGSGLCGRLSSSNACSNCCGFRWTSIKSPDPSLLSNSTPDHAQQQRQRAHRHTEVVVSRLSRAERRQQRSFSPLVFSSTMHLELHRVRVLSLGEVELLAQVELQVRVADLDRTVHRGLVRLPLR